MHEPTKPGFYWFKQTSQANWEPVQVITMTRRWNGENPIERLEVKRMHGLALMPIQFYRDAIWGPLLNPPKEVQVD